MTARKMIDIARQLEVPPTLTLRGGASVTGEIVAAGQSGVQLTPYGLSGSNDVMIKWAEIVACSLPAVKLEFV